MSRGDKLLKASQAATGDDSIIDAAEFMPKEAAQGAVAGAAAGTVLADAKGLAARTFLGREIGARKTELSKHIALVVTRFRYTSKACRKGSGPRNPKTRTSSPV